MVSSGLRPFPPAFLSIRVECQTLADAKAVYCVAQTGQMVLAAHAMDQGRSKDICAAELKGLCAENPSG